MRGPGQRICVECGASFFTAYRKSVARFCSKSCIWKATKGPAFNAEIARATIGARRAALLGRGEGRTYRKLYGRHEHRVVAEKVLGRALMPKEIVHHKDGDYLNNDPSNLEVLTQGEHMRRHGLGIPGQTLWWKPWEYRGRKASALHV